MSYNIKAVGSRLKHWGFFLLLFWCIGFAPSEAKAGNGKKVASSPKIEQTDRGKMFGTLASLRVTASQKKQGYVLTLSDGTKFEFSDFDKVGLKLSGQDSKPDTLALKTGKDYQKALQAIYDKLQGAQSLEITFNRVSKTPATESTTPTPNVTLTPTSNSANNAVSNATPVADTQAQLSYLSISKITPPQSVNPAVGGNSFPSIWAIFSAVFGAVLFAALLLGLVAVVANKRDGTTSEKSRLKQEAEDRHKKLEDEVAQAKTKVEQLFPIIRHIEKFIIDPNEKQDDAAEGEEAFVPLPRRIIQIEESVKDGLGKLEKAQEVLFAKDGMLLSIASANAGIDALKVSTGKDLADLRTSLDSFKKSFDEEVSKLETEDPYLERTSRFSSEDLKLMDKISDKLPLALEKAHLYFPPAETRSLANVLGILNGPNFESRANAILRLASNLTTVNEGANAIVEKLEQARISIDQFHGTKAEDKLGEWKIFVGELSQSLESIQSHLYNIGPKGALVQCKEEWEELDILLNGSLEKSSSISAALTTEFNNDTNLLSELKFVDDEMLPRLKERIRDLTEELAAAIASQNALLNPLEPERDEHSEAAEIAIPKPAWQWPSDISFEAIIVEGQQLEEDFKADLSNQNGQAQRWLQERWQTVSRLMKALEMLQKNSVSGPDYSPELLTQLADSVFGPRFLVSLMSLEPDITDFAQLRQLEARLDNLRLNIKSYIKRHFGLYPVSAPIGEKAYNSDLHTDDGKLRIEVQDPSQHNIIERLVSYGLMLNGKPVMRARVYRYYDGSEDTNTNPSTNAPTVEETLSAPKVSTEDQNETPSLIPGFERNRLSAN